MPCASSRASTSLGEPYAVLARRCRSACPRSGTAVLSAPRLRLRAHAQYTQPDSENHLRRVHPARDGAIPGAFAQAILAALRTFLAHLSDESGPSSPEQARPLPGQSVRLICPGQSVRPILAHPPVDSGSSEIIIPAAAHAVSDLGHVSAGPRAQPNSRRGRPGGSCKRRRSRTYCRGVCPAPGTHRQPHNLQSSLGARSMGL